MAALWVVCAHLEPLFGRFGLKVPGSGAIDLFFVISGFMMVHVAGNKGSVEFFARRVARIVPLYWAMTLFTFAVAAVAPSLFRNTTADLASLAQSLLFIPFVKGGAGVAQPLLFVGWSLNYEMFFYALFATGIALGRNGLAFVFAALIGLPIVGHIVQPTNVIAAFYTAPLLLDFAGGMAVALLLRWRLIPSQLAVALAIACFPLVIYGELIAPGVSRLISQGFPAALILAALVSLESRGSSSRCFTGFADPSYAIYLLHPFLVGAVVIAAERLPESAFVTMALIAGTVAASCWLGKLGYSAFDRPVTTALNQWLKSGSSNHAQREAEVRIDERPGEVREVNLKRAA